MLYVVDSLSTLYLFYAQSSSGDLESARLSNYIIRNTGGTATIDSLTAKSIRVELVRLVLSSLCLQ